LLLVGFLIYWCGRQRTISEIIHTQHHKEDHIEKGHISMGSPGYSAKSVMGLAQYSGHNGGYHPGTMETESHKSASPAVEEHRDLASPTRSLPPVPSHQHGSIDRQPPYSSVVANDIGHQHSPSINGSPRSEVHGGFQPMTMDVDVPIGLRINHRPSQYGPHELAGDARMPQMMEQAPPYRYEKR
jgi:hypothetical protein